MRALFFAWATGSLVLLPFASPSSAVLTSEINVTGTTAATTVATVVRQSAGPVLTLGQGNLGDITLSLDGAPLLQT
jgi:hypothetical protein